jgi:hypothetical protein
MAKFEKGRSKTGGRKAGTTDKITGYIAAREGHQSPFVTMFQMSENRLPCLECRGAKKLTYVVDGKEMLRKCVSCHGSGLERLKPDVVYKATSDLCEFEDAKRRTVEVRAPGLEAKLADILRAREAKTA